MSQQYISYSPVGGAGGGVTDVTASAPLSSSGGFTPNISISLANTSTNGYLSSTDWNTFNNKQNALTFGNLTESTSAILTILGGTGAVIGSGASIQVQQASTSLSGYLSSTDWNTFNNKQDAISGTANTFTGFDSGGLIYSIPGWSIDTVNGGASVSLSLTPADSGGPQTDIIELFAVDIAPSASLANLSHVGFENQISVSGNNDSLSTTGLLNSLSGNGLANRGALTALSNRLSGGDGVNASTSTNLTLIDAAINVNDSHSVSGGAYGLNLFVNAGVNSTTANIIGNNITLNIEGTANGLNLIQNLQANTYINLPAGVGINGQILNGNIGFDVDFFRGITVAPTLAGTVINPVLSFLDNTTLSSGAVLGTFASIFMQPNFQAGASVTDWYDVYVPDSAPGATVTNRYGIYLGADTGLVKNSWLSGKTLIGGSAYSAPTAGLHLPASDGTAGNAPLKIDSGPLLVTPENGAIESDGTDLYWTDNGGTRIQLSNTTGFVTNVTASAPLSSTGGATPDISISQATTSTDGYLSSTDWNTFNGKQSALSFGNLTEATSSMLTITGGTGAVIGSGTTIEVSGVLPAANGGTGQSSYTTGDILYASGASALSKLAAGTSGTFLKSNGAAAPSWADPALLSVATKTANYTLTSTDNIILADSSGGAFTLTLPSAASNTGKLFKIKKITTDFNSVTISGASSSVDTNGEEVEIYSNGSSWAILSRSIPSTWVSYSLSISGTTTNPTKGTTTQDTAFWRRVGDSMEMRYDYAQTVAGSDGSGTYLFSIPAGLTIDTAKIGAVNTICSAVVGDGLVAYSTVIYQTNVAVYDTGNVFLPSATAVNGTQTLFGSATGGLANATVQYSFVAKVPISGWNG